MLILEGADPVRIESVQDVEKPLLWNPALFSTCGLNSEEISDVVSDNLTKISTNNLSLAQVRVNDSANGLDIRYGRSSATDTNAFTKPEKLLPLAMLRYGPIKKPTTLSIDLKAVFGSNLRENFVIMAVCGSVVYSLFSLYQCVIDTNYGWGKNGIWCNNSTTKLKSLSATTTYSGSLKISDMSNCFIHDETTCEIAIVRLEQIYHSGIDAGMKNASALYLKKLEIV